MRRLHYRNGAAQVASDEGVVRITGMSDYAEMQIALRKYFNETRGFDWVGQHKVPRTTNADVQQLAAIWARAVPKARDDIFGVTGAKKDWAALAAEVAQLTTGAEPAEIYPQNTKFWRTVDRIAIRIQVAAEELDDLSFTDSLVENIKALPDRLSDAAGWLVDAAGDVADKVGDTAGNVAEGAGKAAARGLGPIFKPLLIGAGLFGGGYLLIKANEKRRSRRG